MMDSSAGTSETSLPSVVVYVSFLSFLYLYIIVVHFNIKTEQTPNSTGEM